jgi:ATP-dependent Clp protease protease subunit
VNLDKMLRDRNSDEIWVNEFNEESARDFRDSIIDAAKGDPNKPVIIYIDSYGGQVDSLASMIETLDQIPNPVITVAVGKAMSCGAVLLSHGDVRFCGKHTRIMIHEVSGGTGGDVHDVHADALEMKRLNEHFMGLLASNCGIKGGYNSLRKMIKDRDGRDTYLTAAEAMEFGLVDVVGLPKIERAVGYKILVAPQKLKANKVVSSKAKKQESQPKKKKIRK